MANGWHIIDKNLFGYHGLHVWRALCYFGFILSIIVLILLVIGNVQGFLERTQLLLLLILQYNFTFSIFAGLYYTIARLRHRHAGGFVGGLVIGIASIMYGLIGTMVTIFVRGVIDRP